MHIPDGVLSPPVLGAGLALTAGGLALTLRGLDAEAMPRVAVVSAAFFLASTIAVPVGITSVHLVLGGLMGLVLGPAIVPAIFVAHLLQAGLFGFGGLVSLGVNTANLALPATLAALVAGPMVRRARTAPIAGLYGGLAGFLATAGTLAMVAASLVLSDPAYWMSAHIVFVGGVPLLIAETLITAMATAYLFRVRPAMIGRTGVSHA